MVAVVTVFMAVIMVFIWQLLPYLSQPSPPKPEYHAMDITMEEIKVFEISFWSTPTSFLPSKISQRGGIGSGVSMVSGLGRLNIGDPIVKSYNYVFTYFLVSVKTADVGPQAPGALYLLAFFSNSSDVGELFKSYGLPHTYVQALYRCFSRGSVNYTYLRLDGPDGFPLIELSAATPSVAQEIKGGGYRLFYHLNNDNNLTAVYLNENRTYVNFPSRLAHANVTLAEGSELWRYTGWTAYTLRYYFNSFQLMRRSVGKIGWVEWK